MKLMPGARVVSKVYQTGMGNEAIVEQTHNGGFKIKAVIDQSGDKNRALQIQGPDHDNVLGPLRAKITQSGNGNTASQIQYKAFNTATILQSGNGNNASQLQMRSFNYANIDQSGNGNTADQKQYGLNSKAEINQSGDKNTATQEQHGFFNEAYASQSGNGNTSTQIQHKFSAFNYASVSQKGIAGTAWQEQFGNWNKAEIEQGDHSFGNAAKQIQKSDGQGTFGNYVNLAKICQDGEGGNTASQFQMNMFNVIPNEAIITQSGFMNTASQTQFGGDNYSNICQTGAWNNAVVTQTPFIMP